MSEAATLVPPTSMPHESSHTLTGEFCESPAAETSGMARPEHDAAPATPVCHDGRGKKFSQPPPLPQSPLVRFHVDSDCHAFRLEFNWRLVPPTATTYGLSAG